MQHVSLTPFGRQPVTAALLAARTLSAPTLPRIDKWTVFSDLRTARVRFGITDRDLAVLYALLTFLPGKVLEGAANLVVYPSNATLGERAHGMAESTLRRHLAALVRAGLIWRQDSPNGKRYTTRSRFGAPVQSFGFDLKPLLTRATEISRIASEVEAAAEALSRQRASLVLRLRDAAKLIAYGTATGMPGDWPALEARLQPLRALLRRRMEEENLAESLEISARLLADIHSLLTPNPQEESGNDGQNERHHTDSDSELIESEPCAEQGKAKPVCGREIDTSQASPIPTEPKAAQPLPLALVLKACPDILPYARSNLTSWRDLVVLAAEVRGMMGISASAHAEAERFMGAETAAIVVAAILQRIGSISNPGGYLRALSGKAAAGGFSPGPMIMALLNTATARAA